MRIQGDKLVFPELSYAILGAAFRAFNELGRGLSEKDYQRGLAKELESLKIDFQREVCIPLLYKEARLPLFCRFCNRE